MTEWVWVLILIWIFLLVFSYISKDSIVKMLSGFTGVVFGVLYLRTSGLVGLIMVGLNFYFVYSSLEDMS